MLSHKALKAIRNPSLVKNRLKREIASRALDARFGRGYALMPTTVFINPTLKCDLDCATCSMRSHRADPKRNPPGCDLNKEMEPHHWDRIADQLGAFKPVVVISGGEPLVSPLTFPIARRLSRHGVFVSLATNGIRLHEVADQLIPSGFGHVHVSVDGINQDFDDIRGQGKFELLVRSLNAVHRIRQGPGGDKLGINAICVVNPTNVHRLAETYRFLIEHGVPDLVLQHLVSFRQEDLEAANAGLDDPREHACWTWGEVLDPGDVDLDVLKDQIREIQAIQTATPGSSLKIIPDLETHGYERFYSKGPMPPVPGFHCNLLWQAAYIFPDGTVLPTNVCHFRSMGNLTERSFKEIWNGEEFRWVRRNIWKKDWLSICGYCNQPYGGCL